MRRRKKTWTADLTPLLDVIFILLFLVLFTSVRLQTDRVETAEAAQEEAEEAARQAREEAAAAKERAGAMEELLEGATVMTVRVFSEGDHRVVFLEDGQETASLQFDWDSAGDLFTFLHRELSARLADAPGKAPAFLIFRYDAADLYESDYRAVEAAFSEMAAGHKNVFVQIREEDEDGHTGR